MNSTPPLRSNRDEHRELEHFAELLDRDESRSSLDLRRTLQMLWRRKLLVLLVLLVGLGLAALYLARAVPLYTAEAQVRFLTQEEQVTDLESVVSGISPEGATLYTETLVVTSHRLLGRVVESLDLVSDPEFRGSAQLGGSDAASTYGWGPETTAAIETLRKRLTVEVLPNSYVLSIEVVTRDPVKSATIANRIAEAYVESQLEAKFDATRRATVWLSDRVADLRQSLEQSESAVEEFLAASPQVSEEALKISAERLEDLRRTRRDRATRAEFLRQQLVDLETLRSIDDYAQAAQVVDDPLLQRLAARIEQAENAAARATLVSEFDASLELRRRTIEGQITVLESQIASLDTAIEQGDTGLGTRGTELVQLRQLQREAESTRLLYEHFLGRMKETSAQEGVQQPDSEVLTWATVPKQPSYPRPQTIIMRATVVSLVLGTMIAFLLEHMNRRLRTPEELEEASGLPVMAVVPTSPRTSPVAYIVEKPESVLAESVRNLRTSVLISDLDRPPQVIMMTSSVAGEGKSTTLMMLAQVTAQMGKRTLVIEGDLRRPGIRTALRTGKRHLRFPGWQGKSAPGRRPLGLLAALSGNAALEDVVQRQPDTGVDVIFADRADGSRINAADVFSSDRFASFIEEMRTRYDAILLDTPPVLLVPDARLIAHVADSVLYAVRWNSTTHEQVTSGLKLLRQAHVRVSGLALTRVDARALSRYGYEGYGASYGRRSAYYTN